MKENTNKSIQIKLLRYIDRQGKYDGSFAELAAALKENENDINAAVLAVVNRNFIKCRLFEDSIDGAVVMSTGLQYIEKNTVQLLPIRRRISDLIWSGWGYAVSWIIGFVFGVIVGLILPNFYTIPKPEHKTEYQQGQEHSDVESSQKRIISEPSPQTDNSADNHTKKERQ